jgi:hypothetical protein
MRDIARTLKQAGREQPSAHDAVSERDVRKTCCIRFADELPSKGASLKRPDAIGTSDALELIADCPSSGPKIDRTERCA